MDCPMTSSILSANYNTILFEFGVILVTSKILHALLRNVYQPRVFSDLLVRRSPSPWMLNLLAWCFLLHHIYPR